MKALKRRWMLEYRIGSTLQKEIIRFGLCASPHGSKYVQNFLPKMFDWVCFQKQIYIWIHVVQLCGYFFTRGKNEILFPYWHRVGYQWVTYQLIGALLNSPPWLGYSHIRPHPVSAKSAMTSQAEFLQRQTLQWIHMISKCKESSYPGPIVGGYLIIYSPNIYGSSTTWKFVWLLLLWIHGPTKHKFDRMDFPRNCKSLPIGAPPCWGQVGIATGSSHRRKST